MSFIKAITSPSVIKEASDVVEETRELYRELMDEKYKNKRLEEDKVMMVTRLATAGTELYRLQQQVDDLLLDVQGYRMAKDELDSEGLGPK